VTAKPKYRRIGVWPQDFPCDRYCWLDADGGWSIVYEIPAGYRMGTIFKSDLLGGERIKETETDEDFLVFAQAMVVKDSPPST
jgi:hypothetical protein